MMIPGLSHPEFPSVRGVRVGATGHQAAMYLIKERLLHLGKDSQITDDGGRVVFDVDGKVLSLHHRLVVKDPAGNDVADVQKRLVSLRPAYTVTIGGKQVAV